MSVRIPVTAGVLAFLDLTLILTSSDRLRRRKTVRDARGTANPLTLQSLNSFGLVVDPNVGVTHGHLHVGLPGEFFGFRNAGAAPEQLRDMGVPAGGVEVCDPVRRLVGDVRQPRLLRSSFMSSVFDSLTTVLKNHGICCETSARTLSVTERTVTDICHPDEVVSRAVIDAIWPSQRDVTVHHYTTADAAESILRSGIWRLYALRKRFDEGEIVDFCKAQRLQGYLESDANGEPVYKDLNMANMFYASFTPIPVAPTGDAYLWNVFTKGNGVRFTIRLRAKNPNLRAIYYPPRAAEPIPLLADLQNCTRMFGKEFVLAGISRMCAFYLHAGLNIENEVRMLYRKWPGFGPTVENDGTHDFIGVPLGQESPTGFQIDVVELQTNDVPRFAVFGNRIVSRTP